MSPTPTAVIASGSDAIHADATRRFRLLEGITGHCLFAMTALERADAAL